VRAANALELIVIVESRDLDHDVFGLTAVLEEEHG
jgi:hypothetical protein